MGGGRHCTAPVSPTMVRTVLLRWKFTSTTAPTTTQRRVQRRMQRRMQRRKKARRIQPPAVERVVVVGGSVGRRAESGTVLLRWKFTSTTAPTTTQRRVQR